MLSLLFISALLLCAASVQARPHPLLANLPIPRASQIPVTLSPSSITTAAAPNCGIGSYDFSSLMTSDWAGLADDYSEIYYVNLCHSVTNLWCTLNANTASVQACQVSPQNTQYTYNLMGNDTSATTWSYINGKDGSNGVQFKSQTGDGGGGCPHGGKRVTVGRLVCGNSTGVISSVAEGPACTYTMTIPNTMVCQAGQAVDEYNQEVEKVQRVMESMRQGKGMAQYL